MKYVVELFDFSSQIVIDTAVFVQAVELTHKKSCGLSIHLLFEMPHHLEGSANVDFDTSWFRTVSR